MVKKLLALFLVVLISIESFGAVVSDNDGSAFITKAEFDSLKNEFQSQLDNYNTTIDAKLDEAISSYLAGIKVKNSLELESIINKINGSTKYDKGWFPMCKTFSPITTKKPVNGQLALNVVGNGGGGGAANNGWRSSFSFSLNLNHSNALVRDTLYYIDIPSTKTDGVYYVYKKNRNGNFKMYDGKYVTMSYKELFTGVQFGYGKIWNFTGSVIPTWTVGVMANSSSIWTPMSTTVNYTIMNWNDAGTEIATPYDRAVTCLWVPSFDATDVSQVWPVMGSCDSSANLIALDTENYTTMTLSNTKSTFKSGFKGLAFTHLNGADKTNTTNNGALGSDFEFYYNYHPYEEIAMSDLAITEIADVLDNKKFPFYSGLPICKIADDGIVTIELEFHSESGNDIKYAIRADAFQNDASYVSDTALNIRKMDETPITSYEISNNSTLKLKLNVKKGTVLWIKTCDANSDTGYTGVKTISISEEFT